MKMIITYSNKVNGKDFYASDVLSIQKNFGRFSIMSDVIFTDEKLKADSVYDIQFNRQGRCISCDYLEEAGVLDSLVKKMSRINKDN